MEMTVNTSNVSYAQVCVKYLIV